MKVLIRNISESILEDKLDELIKSFVGHRKIEIDLNGFKLSGYIAHLEVKKNYTLLKKVEDRDKKMKIESMEIFTEDEFL